MTTAWLAADGHEAELDDELGRAGVAVTRRHGRLRIAEGRPVHAAWAANTWWDATHLQVASIGDAARQLRALHGAWWLYAPDHRGRAELVAERLPHVSGRTLSIDEVAPDVPLGSWTMLERDLVLAAVDCASPFPNGVPTVAEDRHGPPSRAYLKLWEVFARLRRRPAPDERCLDLGAAPGGWSWLLARTGAEVIAVDRAPLDPAVAALPNVTARQGSAFALDPDEHGPVDWLVSDVVAYPDRLLTLLRRWIAADAARTIVCTVKFQGTTDHEAVAAFTALPGARMVHLHHNKHELTCIVE